jgi:hypothetical protein
MVNSKAHSLKYENLELPDGCLTQQNISHGYLGTSKRLYEDMPKARLLHESGRNEVDQEDDFWDITDRREVAAKLLLDWGKMGLDWKDVLGRAVLTGNEPIVKMMRALGLS